MRDMLSNSVNIGDSVAFIFHSWSDKLRVEKVDGVTPDGVTVTVRDVYFKYNPVTGKHDIPVEATPHEVHLKSDQFVRALRDAS